MISVRFRPALDMPWVRVEIPDEKLHAVLVRAAERVFPGPVDPKLEAESEKRFQAVMLARKVKA